MLTEEVFGSQEKAAQWLQKPRKALGDISALDAIATTPGFIAIDELLEQQRYRLIASGIPG
ncbi:MbcA/ParS/Xre antitoxin family protein [Halomonas aquatica]|uniref:MbcA/ParS/Xre antitoxin family protein n=1 Tax=Halomonas aquatica TaxID=3151123 RepID=UPI003D80DD95